MKDSLLNGLHSLHFKPLEKSCKALLLTCKHTTFLDYKKNEGKKLENEARLQTNEFFH